MAKLERGSYERFEAVIGFLRLQAYAKAWCNAFSVCEDGYTYEMVQSDMMYRIDELRFKFKVSYDEERVAQQFVGSVYFNDYWF